MTAALEEVKWSAARPAALYLRERPGTHCTGGCVDIRACRDRCGKSRIYRDSILDRPARSSAAIPTEPPGPHVGTTLTLKCSFCKNEAHSEVSLLIGCATGSSGFDCRRRGKFSLPYRLIQKKGKDQSEAHYHSFAYISEYRLHCRAR